MGIKNEGLGEICRRQGWPIHRVDDLNSTQAVDFVRSLNPTIAVFTGGGMIRPALIEACGEGVLNCHMGPLPRYRGMDVVEWPFLEKSDCARTAVTVHFMDQGLDTGPIAKVADIPRAGCSSISDLRVAAEGLKIDVLMQTIKAHCDGVIRAQRQLPSEGRQYFVMHKDLLRIANKKAAEALSRKSSISL
jgi:methionyl-tRNA formyltransferase